MKSARRVEQIRHQAEPIPLALQIVLPRREEVGAYIAHVVDRWDTETLVDRLELQVGRDLQYVRINGTLVGALIGSMLFLMRAALPALLPSLGLVKL